MASRKIVAASVTAAESASSTSWHGEYDETVSASSSQAAASSPGTMAASARSARRKARR